MTDTITIPQVTDSGAVRGMMYALRGRYRFLDTIPIGRSVLGREIFGLLLGGGNGPEKVLFAAAFHGQEWLTALTVLRLCENICEAMQKDGKLDDLDLRQALAGRSLILVPMVNPDGVDIALRGARGRRPLCRAGRRPGGRPAGLWQANARGVDINHNFNAGWALLQELERKKGIDGPAPRQWGGPCPESEPETRALTGLWRPLPLPPRGGPAQPGGGNLLAVRRSHPAPGPDDGRRAGRGQRLPGGRPRGPGLPWRV